MDDQLADNLNEILETAPAPAPEPEPESESEPVPTPALAPEPLPIPGHTVTVAEVDNPMYPYLVTCTCNWQAHAKTEQIADYWRRSHEGTQRYLAASKGFQAGHV